MADFAASILEAQEEIHMERLTLKEICSKFVDEPVAEDRRLINALVNSGITKLIELKLRQTSWFADIETQSYLFDFIRQQTCLKELDLGFNDFSSEATTQILSILLESSNLETIE